ncbi:MAG: hypothetical protein ACHQQR_05265 [Gemmatimonadales bacterium]
MTFDPRALVTRTAREEKRLAYNCAEALNNTAKAAQEDMRIRMMQIFQLRATTKRDRHWLLEQIKLTFASVKKGVIFAELYVQPRARLLLAGFETGAMREPFVGKDVAVPNVADARAGGSVAGEIQPQFQFGKMRLKAVTVIARTHADTTQFKGANRLFLLKSTKREPLGGVFQRVGPGKDDIRLVWSFHRAFKLREVLQFLPTVARTMNDKFRVEWAISNARNPSR